MRPPPDAPIVALDIDGTSGDYHAHFTRFAEQYLGRSLPDPEENTGGLKFYKHLGIARSTYRTIKLAYRQGGMKRSMPVYEGMGDLTKYIRNKGAQVWICTTRPYLRLDNIDPDTRHWLTKRAHMQYDGILYGEHKYRDLSKSVGRDRVLFVVDDLPEMTEQALKLGIPALIRRQPYNEHYRSDRVTPVSSVAEIRREFDTAMEKWRSNEPRA